MFEKLKYLIDMNVMSFWYSFYTNYMKNRFDSTSTRVFNRPSDYLNNQSNCNYDYIVNGYPIWVEPIECSEYLKIGNIFPNISNIGLVSPVCSGLFDTRDRTKPFGYIILIPFEYIDDMKLYEFVLGHELGHITYKHLSSNPNAKLVNDVEKEIIADQYSLTRHADNYLSVEDCISGLNKIFEISIKTTIENIPYLKKKYENKIDEVISRFKKYNKSYKKRLNAISKLV